MKMQIPELELNVNAFKPRRNTETREDIGSYNFEWEWI